MCNKGRWFNWWWLPKEEVCSHSFFPLPSLPRPFHLVLVLMCASWLSKSTKIQPLPSLPSQRRKREGGKSPQTYSIKQQKIVLPPSPLLTGWLPQRRVWVKGWCKGGVRDACYEQDCIFQQIPGWNLKSSSSFQREEIIFWESHCWAIAQASVCVRRVCSLVGEWEGALGCGSTLV